MRLPGPGARRTPRSFQEKTPIPSLRERRQPRPGSVPDARRGRPARHRRPDPNCSTGLRPTERDFDPRSADPNEPERSDSSPPVGTLLRLRARLTPASHLLLGKSGGPGPRRGSGLMMAAAARTGASTSGQGRPSFLTARGPRRSSFPPAVPPRRSLPREGLDSRPRAGRADVGVPGGSSDHPRAPPRHPESREHRDEYHGRRQRRSRRVRLLTLPSGVQVSTTTSSAESTECTLSTSLTS